MKDFFGYKVADKCFMKQMRPSYRFSKERCVLYDKSYFIVYRILDSDGSGDGIQNFLRFFDIQTAA